MRKRCIVYQILFLILINFVFALSVSAAPSKLAKGMEWSYVIKLNGQPFTYTKVTLINQEGLSNQDLWTIKDESIYKIKLERDHLDEYRSRTIVKLRDDFTLVNLSITVKKNGVALSSKSIEKKDWGYLYHENTAGKIIKENINTEKHLFLYDPTLPWLIEILIKNNILTPQKRCSAISMPDKVMSIKYLTNSIPADDKDEYICYMAGNDEIYVDQNQNVVRINSKDNGIIEVIPGENFSEEKLTGYDINNIQNTPSNISSLKTNLLTKMTIYLCMEKGLINVDYLKNSSLRQSFRGTINDKKIEGEVTIVRDAVQPQNPLAFPVMVEWKPELQKYLGSSQKIEADNPEIVFKAKQITKDSDNIWDAARAIAVWTYKNIKPEYAGDLSALDTLKMGKGECGPISLLTAALCRSVNIPARVITGYVYVYDFNAFALHYWVEVYTGKNGWKSIDPALGQFNFLDPSHIGLSDEFCTLYFSSMKPVIIKILNYEPYEAGSSQ